MDDNNQDAMQKGPHYVCKSCGGVSNNPKNCDTEGCSLNGHPLTECNCEDGQHLMIKEEKVENEQNI